MNFDKRSLIINKLLAKTRQGVVDWEESFSADGYMTTRGGISILIGKGENENDQPLYNFKLFNEYNDVVDEFSDEDLSDEEMFHTCVELYSLARGYAKGTEQLLDRLLNSLNDDDVPF